MRNADDLGDSLGDLAAALRDFEPASRSFSADLPVSRSQVHLTSLAVNGLPSCHLTPWRNGRVCSVPSSFHDQPVARSGTIDAMLFCATAAAPDFWTAG